jgi:hypothetical protein
MFRILLLVTITQSWLYSNDQFSLQRADLLFESRFNHYNSKTKLVDTVCLNKAIDIYSNILKSKNGPEQIEAAWKILRTLNCKGMYGSNDKKVAQSTYKYAKSIAEDVSHLFPESVPVRFWSAIIWGSWAQVYGIWNAAREGAADVIKAHCEVVIARDEKYEHGGGYRILGRLHVLSPTIPVILPWPSKKKAREFFEKAYSIDSTFLWNKLYLGEYYMDYKMASKGTMLLEQIEASGSTFNDRIEYDYIDNKAHQLLSR